MPKLQDGSVLTYLDLDSLAGRAVRSLYPATLKAGMARAEANARSRSFSLTKGAASVALDGRHWPIPSLWIFSHNPHSERESGWQLFAASRPGTLASECLDELAKQLTEGGRQ